MKGGVNIMYNLSTLGMSHNHLPCETADFFSKSSHSALTASPVAFRLGLNLLFLRIGLDERKTLRGTDLGVPCGETSPLFSPSDTSLTSLTGRLGDLQSTVVTTDLRLSLTHCDRGAGTEIIYYGLDHCI